VTREGEADGQQPLFDDDFPAVRGAFDCKSLAIKPKTVGFKLVSPSDGEGLKDLVGRTGRITIMSSEDAPEDDPTEASESADDEEADEEWSEAEDPEGDDTEDSDDDESDE
jgi:hypothetical protein